MSSYNKVILMGNITRDLELRYIANGTAVVTVGLAVNEKYQGKDKTLFIDCAVWGKQAETLCQFSGKGNCVLVEGTLELDSWADKDGKKRSKHKVNVSRFQFMGGKSDNVKPDPVDMEGSSRDEVEVEETQENIPF